MVEIKDKEWYKSTYEGTGEVIKRATVAKMKDKRKVIKANIFPHNNR